MNATEKMQGRTVEEQKQDEKFLFQFVSHETGKRSEPFVSNWDKLTTMLNELDPETSPTDDDYLLLVAILDGKDTRIPATPLITVKTFRQFSIDKEALNNG